MLSLLSINNSGHCGSRGATTHPSDQAVQRRTERANRASRRSTSPCSGSTRSFGTPLILPSWSRSAPCFSPTSHDPSVCGCPWSLLLKDERSTKCGHINLAVRSPSNYYSIRPPPLLPQERKSVGRIPIVLSFLRSFEPSFIHSSVCLSVRPSCSLSSCAAATVAVQLLLWSCRPCSGAFSLFLNLFLSTLEGPLLTRTTAVPRSGSSRHAAKFRATRNFRTLRCLALARG